MELHNYKPGRKLDALVAMCLGWRWQVYLKHFGPVRYLMEFPEGGITRDADKSDCPADDWMIFLGDWSTNSGHAFEAALKAFSLKEDDFWAKMYFSGERNCIETDYGELFGESPAHCICLAILSLQSEETIKEFDLWLT